jgi:hypothetical protein
MLRPLRMHMMLTMRIHERLRRRRLARRVRGRRPWGLSGPGVAGPGTGLSWVAVMTGATCGGTLRHLGAVPLLGRNGRGGA